MFYRKSAADFWQNWEVLTAFENKRHAFLFYFVMEKIHFWCAGNGILFIQDSLGKKRKVFFRVRNTFLTLHTKYCINILLFRRFGVSAFYYRTCVIISTVSKLSVQKPREFWISSPLRYIKWIKLQNSFTVFSWLSKKDLKCDALLCIFLRLFGFITNVVDSMFKVLMNDIGAAQYYHNQPLKC